MGLFDNFDNIYDADQSPSQIANMKVGCLPYEYYDPLTGKLDGYYWHYGDSIELHFLIDGEITTDDGQYVDLETFLEGKFLRIQFYNFRYESIKDLETVLDASTDVKLIIDEETSKKLLRGTYYLTATVFKDNEAVYVPIIENKDCKITVK